MLNFSPPPTKEVGAFADDLSPILFVVVEGPNIEKEIKFTRLTRSYNRIHLLQK